MRKKLLTVFVLLFFTPLILGQQSTKISGTVTDKDGAPLPSANIFIPALNLGAAADENGKYEFSVPAEESTGQNVDMTARYVGYKSQTVSVNLGGGNVEQNFSLEEDVFQSEAVVVTGIASKTSKSVAEVSVSRLDAVDYTKDNSYQSFSQLLAGKISGVQLTHSSGNVGVGFQLYVRGGGGLNGNEQPIVYIDGVRVDNSELGFYGVGGQGISALSDINPDDIENIEVLKGPAGAALYGTDGSNGVILITTKRGSTMPGGKGISIDYKYTYGVNSQASKYSKDVFQSADAANKVFVDGIIREHAISASGGTNLLRYYGGFASRDEGGIVPGNNLSRKSANASISAYPNDQITIRLNGAFTYDDINQPTNDNDIEGFLGNTLLLPPPYNYAFTDSVSILGIKNINKINQFTGNISATYSPIRNLEFDGSVGVDNRNYVQSQTHPSNLPYSGLISGARDIYNDENKQFTYTLNARYSYNFAGINATSVLGSQLFNRDHQYNVLSTEELGSSYITDIGSGGITTAYGEYFENTRQAGIYMDNSFSYQNKYFFTLGIRRDYASTIGLKAPNIWYPKTSAAIRLDRLGVIPTSFFQLLKLRAAYGESGQLPSLTDGVPLLWTYLIGGYGTGGIIASIGNEDIKPERVKEIEIGLDAQFLDIFSLEFTYYTQNATNSIIGFQNPPTTGLTATSVPKNIGSVKSHGIESLLQVSLLRSQDYALNLSMIWNYQTNEVTDLGGAAPIFDNQFATNVYAVGLRKHEFYMQVPVSPIFDPQTHEYVGANLSTERQDLGNPIPDWTGSFTVNFKFLKNFNLYALCDWALNRKMYNNTLQFASNDLLTGSLVPTQYANSVKVNEIGSKLSNLIPGSAEYIAAAYEFMKVDATYNANYIEDAQYFRIEEVSLSYSLKDLLQNYFSSNYISDIILGFSARNIFTATPYSGADPTVNQSGARGLERGDDFLTLQSPKVLSFWTRVVF